MDDVKTRILEAAAEILERDGAQAVSTRSVAAAAGIRAASLYQLFGDKDGLLSALATHAFALYLSEKHTVARTGDPVADMRRGWDTHVDFGVRHPALYLLMFGTDRPARRPPAAAEAHRVLLAFLDRVAAAGRLRLPPATAADLLQAAATGVTQLLIATPAETRDPDLSPRLRDSVIASMTTDAPPPTAPGLAPPALALDAALASTDPADVPLRPAETALLRDWLTRLAR